MKKRLYSRGARSCFAGLFVLLFILALQILPNRIEAQSSQAVYLYLPSTGNIEANSNQTLDFRINSTDAITSVKATLAFDSARLSVDSIDSSTSDFGTPWEQIFDNTAGTISIQRSTPAPGVSGDKLITKITFKAKSTLGNTTVGYHTDCFSSSDPYGPCLALKADNTDILASGSAATLTVIAQSTPTPTSSSYGTPSYGTPSYGTPSYGTPDSSSYGTPSYGTPSSSGSKIGDLNNDGKVNIFDLSILLRNWNKTGTGDLNSDGKVNIFDLSIMLRNWTR